MQLIWHDTAYYKTIQRKQNNDAGKNIHNA